MVVGNIGWVVGTIVLLNVVDSLSLHSPSAMFTQTASSFLSTWWAIGAMLGIVDVAALMAFVSSAFGGR
ncbi:hypothetical protein [Halarchaeum nitratireducens]|uniref:Uncharacterized protein n=1 Tax=Halarchaeum nitratireducens TaxID=489913 RepID=A0A830GFN4_9EURY|nr:hypothetical protein [Halarchaeum nitratireducens]GGN26311.1 hypothetical protein GCM10009021_30710 [Halarchaeum nitratireducens]